MGISSTTVVVDSICSSTIQWVLKDLTHTSDHQHLTSQRDFHQQKMGVLTTPNWRSTRFQAAKKSWALTAPDWISPRKFGKHGNFNTPRVDINEILASKNRFSFFFKNFTSLDFRPQILGCAREASFTKDHPTIGFLWPKWISPRWPSWRAGMWGATWSDGRDLKSTAFWFSQWIANEDNDYKFELGDLALRDSGAWTIRFAQALTVQGPQDPNSAAGCYEAAGITLYTSPSMGVFLWPEWPSDHNAGLVLAMKKTVVLDNRTTNPTWFIVVYIVYRCLYRIPINQPLGNGWDTGIFHGSFLGQLPLFAWSKNHLGWMNMGLDTMTH